MEHQRKNGDTSTVIFEVIKEMCLKNTLFYYCLVLKDPKTQTKEYPGLL